MTQVEIRQGITDRVAFIGTLYGECRQEPVDGIIAVACVIRNRVNADLGHDAKPDWWGEGYAGVCLKRSQFSCWWEDNGNTRAVYTVAESLLVGRTLGEMAVIAVLARIADEVMQGKIKDITNGADHYLTAALFKSSARPSWAVEDKIVARFGNHVFLKLT